MKKAERKARREDRRKAASERRGGVVSARETPSQPPAPTTLVDLQDGSDGVKDNAAAMKKKPHAARPYVWRCGSDGSLRSTDALIHVSGTVVATLDEVPQLRRLRLLRERQAERQYGIPAAVPTIQAEG